MKRYGLLAAIMALLILSGIASRPISAQEQVSSAEVVANRARAIKFDSETMLITSRKRLKRFLNRVNPEVDAEEVDRIWAALEDFKQNDTEPLLNMPWTIGGDKKGTSAFHNSGGIQTHESPNITPNMPWSVGGNRAGGQSDRGKAARAFILDCAGNTGAAVLVHVPEGEWSGIFTGVMTNARGSQIALATGTVVCQSKEGCVSGHVVQTSSDTRWGKHYSLNEQAAYIMGACR